MARRYNYFDDDDVQFSTAVKEKRKNGEKSKAPDAGVAAKKLLAVLKYIISVVGVNVLMLGKKLKTISYKGGSSNKAKTRGIIVSLVAIVLVIVLIVTTVIHSANRANKKANEYNDAAFKVCSTYTSKYGITNYKYMNSEYGVKAYMLTGLCLVREIDFNNDSSNELLLVYNSGDNYYADVWGFVGSKFKKVFSQQIVTNGKSKENIWLCLYTKGEHTMLAQHSKDSYKDVKILEFHTDEFRTKTQATFDNDSQQFHIKRKDVTDSFERIRLTSLKEFTASKMTDSALDTMDSFSATASISKNINQRSINSVYSSLVDDYHKKYGVAKVDNEGKLYYIDGLAVVDLIDFNNDDVDELVLVYRRATNVRDEDYHGNYISQLVYKYSIDIYSFNGSIARLVYQNEDVSNLMNDNDTMYVLTKADGNKVKYCQNKFATSNYGRTVNASSKVFDFSGDRFEQEFKSSYETEYGYTEYYIDGERTYKNRFAEKGGYDVAMFDGTESYDSSIWSVSYVQSNKSKEAYLSSRVTQTEETIKSLNK